MQNTVIIGAGPAGLTAGYALVEKGFRPIILERTPLVGGISRTETYKGYRFDIGGHRFYTKIDRVEQLWHQLLGDDFRTTNRLSRIYYNQKFYDYPIQLRNTLQNLGLAESFRILASYCHAKIVPHYPEDTLENWLHNRFGQRLYETFFKTYTEKVWGIPCSEIRAEWGAQRIKGLSLRAALLGDAQNAKSLIHHFHYPRFGPGMMWEAFQAQIEANGGTVACNTPVVRIAHDGQSIHHVQSEQDEIITTPHLISTMPLSHLVCQLHPRPPQPIVEAAQGLRYRDFILVGLIVNRAELFPDNWLYIHDAGLKVGRIQNFKNWSRDMIPDPSTTSLGMEYFCTRGDALWQSSNEALIDLATNELVELGLAQAGEIVDGVVFRQPRAYPIYDGAYQQHLNTIKGYLERFENLTTIGRNAMHRYNNQDHSMLTALLAVENLLGANHDLWSVNTERSYYEEWQR